VSPKWNAIPFCNSRAPFRFWEKLKSQAQEMQFQMGIVPKQSKDARSGTTQEASHEEGIEKRGKEAEQRSP
jgi:hypothetical protein